MRTEMYQLEIVCTTYNEMDNHVKVSMSCDHDMQHHKRAEAHPIVYYITHTPV